MDANSSQSQLARGLRKHEQPSILYFQTRPDACLTDPPAYEDQYYSTTRQTMTRSGPLEWVSGQDFSGSSRTIALPQTSYGQGAPFLRGYSSELCEAGVPKDGYFRWLDALNVSMVPNPEAQIIGKAAGIASWFVPGVGGIVLGLSSIGALIGSGIQLKTVTATCLSQGNRSLFNPAGFEAVICSTHDLNVHLGLANQSQACESFQTPYQQRLQNYGALLSSLTTVLPPATGTGRSDPSAQLGARLSSRSRSKAQRKAAKDLANGKVKKASKFEARLCWLLIRPLEMSVF
ncbi:uncharacterized protein L969DRAFT_103108 [Mixia osmundae IAM 14324]|uniref:Uncharacterized protein n=1 Tax=Mixia osmundae (strain CBS 9802 / IAM 14324 / JCM 22182 / KY 12970) TaxID=764103 RepID=G7E894_MIXOS|nr:uncharacterized protein L969DRAFT_103108 [Mixia osmundae IAM 14324]KEI39158.1 hypothetical protein L969DRAFT_103108 [Mixia osmundae IAM 14324]GAA99054.1 hypothetical protein E5Q_05743 [Mixia osmundae IAM 14324]